MTLARLGTLSLGQAVPVALTASAAITAAAGVTAGELSAKIAGLIEAQVRMVTTPPTIAGSLTAALGMVASIEAAIALGVPDVSFQLAAVVALLAELEATLAALQVQLDLAASLTAVLNVGGVFAYAYAGRADGIGSAFSAELAGGFPGGGPADASNALILATTTPATWAAMQTVFRTSP